MTFLEEMRWRGFFYQCSQEAALEEEMRKGPICAYIGFDCTAPSLHVGSLMQIMMLHWFQHYGHRPVVLLGGGTTKVGDPSFRAKERPILSHEEILANQESLGGVFSRFLRFGESGAILANNATWLDKLEYIPFLREVGVYFNIGRMLSFDSVKSRLEREQSLSFLEFNYMILQAYDFYVLHQEEGCVLQMGGSDQWGNIVNGIELIHKKAGKQAFCLTSPLLTTASGQKMGKTESGAVWLKEELLSAYDYWQFWRNTQDADVVKFLKLFTKLSKEEIAKIEQWEGEQCNEAKVLLATEATTLLHGKEKAQAAKERAQKIFTGKSLEDLPVLMLDVTRAQEGLLLIHLLHQEGHFASLSEVRRFIRGGGLKLDDAPMLDENLVLTPEMIGQNGLKLSLGKKKHVLVRIAQ